MKKLLLLLIITMVASSSPCLSASQQQRQRQRTNSQRSANQQSRSSQKSTYTFYSSASVIDYLKHRTFECQGLRLRISDEGFTVNGNYGGGAPYVKYFNENYAVIQLHVIPSTTLTFYVYPDEDILVSQDRDVWRAR